MFRRRFAPPWGADVNEMVCSYTGARFPDGDSMTQRTVWAPGESPLLSDTTPCKGTAILLVSDGKSGGEDGGIWIVTWSVMRIALNESSSLSSIDVSQKNAAARWGPA